MPRSALASWPVMSHEMVVGADSEVCSKITCPVIFESPRMTATGEKNGCQQDGHVWGRVRQMEGSLEVDAVAPSDINGYV